MADRYFETWRAEDFGSMPAAVPLLRDLHDEINAIGGQPRDEYERGINDAVGRALAIIEAKQAELHQ